MKEAARLERNRQRLEEVFPPMAAQVRRVLDRLEGQGFRPRIQDAWRSEADQLIAFKNGNSKVKFGFHNIVGAGGAKEALACDVLDDDNPLAPPTRYLLALTMAARAEGLETLVLMNLTAAGIAKVEAALASGNIDTPVAVGSDPTHVQVAGITIAQAKAGARPGGGTARSAAPVPPQTRASVRGGVTTTLAVHVVRRGETLSGIAKAHGTTLARLLELNPQFKPNPNLIHPGDPIRLP